MLHKAGVFSYLPGNQSALKEIHVLPAFKPSGSSQEGHCSKLEVEPLVLEPKWK